LSQGSGLCTEGADGTVVITTTSNGSGSAAVSVKNEGDAEQAPPQASVAAVLKSSRGNSVSGTPGQPTDSGHCTSFPSLQQNKQSEQQQHQHQMTQPTDTSQIASERPRVTWVGPDGVTHEEEFDAVIIATGVRPAIQLCEGLGPRLQAALQSVPHESSEVVVHTDTRFMPAKRSDWMPVSGRALFDMTPHLLVCNVWPLQLHC
jgi:hypothetical protein